MKILLRILIILAVAAVVVGATAGVTQLSAVQAAMGSTGAGHHRDFPQASSTTGAVSSQSGSTALTDTNQSSAASTGDQPGERFGNSRGAQGSSLLGLSEVLKNLAIVAAVSLVFVAGSWLSHRLRPRLTPAAVSKAVQD